MDEQKTFFCHFSYFLIISSIFFSISHKLIVPAEMRDRGREELEKDRER